MTDIGFGANIQRSIQQENKTSETNKVSKKDKSKSRETLAGGLQVEGKYKKEEAGKSEGRYKAYKNAYQYLLGEHPEEEEHIEEEMESAPLEEEQETEKSKKPSLEEIEEYENVRERFKAKVKLLLGEEFDEDAPPEEEEILTSEEKEENNNERLLIAKESFRTLHQYIADSLGSFDFDRTEDLKLLLKYGIPEDALLKFIFLQQLSRSGIDFPNILDISIIHYKLKKLEIPKSEEELIEYANSHFDTAQKLKYTVSGFIYVPLMEVLTQIEEDLADNFYTMFQTLLNEFEQEEFPDLSKKLSRNIMLSLRDISLNQQKEIIELSKQKLLLLGKINQLPAKLRETSQEQLENINKKIELKNKALTDNEYKIAEIILIYSFLNSGQNISEYNKNYPAQAINYTLSLLKVRNEREEIRQLIAGKISIHTLDKNEPEKPEPLKKSVELVETKIKSAQHVIGKQPPPKQQQIIRNLRNNSFDTNTSFYWLKQRNIPDIISISQELKDIYTF